MKTNKLILLFLLPAILIFITACKLERVMQVSTESAAKVSPTTAELSGKIIDHGEGITKHGHCWATTQNPSVSNSKNELGKPSKNDFTSLLTNLVPGTKYYYRAYCSNDSEVSYGLEKSFITTACTAAAATTNIEENVTSLSATLKGTVNANNSSTTVTFEYGLTTSYGSTVAASPSPVTGSSSTSVSASVGSLSPGTTYHYRVKAVNCGGIATGSDRAFTTCTAPSATIGNASSMTTTSATLNGSVNANGCSTVVTFEYGLTTSYGTSVTAAQSPVTGSSLKSVSASITGLSPATTYYFRIKAVNSTGTVYSGGQSFNTTCPVPSATTGGNTVSSTTATITGTVNANGYSTAVTFEYGLTTSYGSVITASQSPVLGSSNTTVSAALTGLLSGTEYHYRVKAVNCGGTVYGNDRTFTTLCVLPTATTKLGSGNTSKVTLNGTVNANGCITTVTFEYSIAGVGSYTINAIPNTVTGNSDTNVLCYIYDNLLPGVNLTYRVKAVNSAGTVYGSYNGIVIGLK